MRFGILGTGRITRRLVPDLQSSPGVTVAAIASRDAARARWSADQYGIVHHFGSYETLLSSDLIDAVYIALPPSMHAAYSIQAAKAGKHVLCEKPLATNYNEAVAIAAAAKQAGVRWLDATAWLHHPRSRAAMHQIEQGALGTLRHVTSAVSFFKPFQAQDHRQDPSLGGGCLLDLGWYAAGAAIAVAGRPERVWATAIHDSDVTLRVSAILWHRDGVTANIQCGYDTATRKWVEWVGDQASLVCDDFTRPWPERPSRFWIHDRAGNVVKQEFEMRESQERAMIAHFASDQTLEPLQQQALDTQLTLDALARSIQTQQPESLESL